MSEDKIKVDLSADPHPLPKVGDTVNYVAPNSMKITSVTVATVPDEHKGRVVGIEQGTEKKKITMLVPHRPVTVKAGNTWHWPAKAAAMLIGLFALVLSAVATLPTYHVFSGAGNHAAPTTIYLPNDANSQIRIIYVNYICDTNNAAVSFASGTTMYTVTATNLATSAVTNLINSTNGLAVGATLVLDQSGKCYANTVASWGLWASSYVTNGAIVQTNNTWYVTLNSGGWGAFTAVGNNVELLGPSLSIPVASGAGLLSGDDIFSGNYGRDVQVTLSPALATNQIYSLSSHYDSASQ